MTLHEEALLCTLNKCQNEKVRPEQVFRALDGDVRCDLFGEKHEEAATAGLFTLTLIHLYVIPPVYLGASA